MNLKKFQILAKFSLKIQNYGKFGFWNKSNSFQFDKKIIFVQTRCANALIVILKISDDCLLVCAIIAACFRS